MDTTEQYIKYIFNLAGIGMPYRVDFAPCGISKGFKAYMQDAGCYKSAFVHFHSFYPDAGSVISFEGLHLGLFQIVQFEPCWRILKNRNPVSTTMMNSHQIVANCCALEERVAQLEHNSKTFDAITRRISILEDNLYRLSDFVLDKFVPISREQDYDTVSSHSSMPMLQSELSTEDEDYEEDDTAHTIHLLKQVSQHLDADWLDKAIQTVDARVQVIHENNDVASTLAGKRERILFTADICGNE